MTIANPANPPRGPAIIPDTASDAASDTELWSRAAAGDRQAFGELFERHVEAVWNHGYRLTASWSQAEDLTSNTFLLAWRKCAEVRLIRDSALPWLYTVTGNLARTEHRGATRFLRALRRVTADGVAAGHADDVARRVDGDARMARVLAAVRSLPGGEREAVELCLLGELSTADAAELLGLAEVGVRSRLSRARAHLRTKLKELVMTDLDLPPRRTLPKDTRDRLRRSVTTSTTPRPASRSRAPLAVAAGVAVLALGAVVVTQSVHDEQSPEFDPGQVPPTASGRAPDPDLDVAAMNAVLDRCAAALPTLGARERWVPAMGVAAGDIAVVATWINGKAAICQTSSTAVTVTDPSTLPTFAEHTRTGLLLSSSDGVFAGVADPTWQTVGLDVRDPAGTLSVPATTRLGFFVAITPLTYPVVGTQQVHVYDLAVDNATAPAWEQTPAAVAPAEPLRVVDRAGPSTEGDRVLLDRCVAATPDLGQDGWAPAAGTIRGSSRLLLARVGDMLALCRHEPKAGDGEKQYTFEELPPAPATTRLCRIQHVMTAGNPNPPVAVVVRKDAAYVQVYFDGQNTQQVPVVNGTFIIQPGEAARPGLTVRAYDQENRLLDEAPLPNCQ